VTCRVSSKRWVLRPNRCAHDVAGLVVMEDRNIIPLKKEVSRG
jgi:hypothetical protein